MTKPLILVLLLICAGVLGLGLGIRRRYYRAAGAAA